MGDGHAIVEEQARHEGRAHAFTLRLAFGGLVNDLVRPGDRIAQHDRLPHHAGFGFHGIAFFAQAGLGDELQNRLDGNAAGDFTGVIAAHAVGQHEQAGIAIGADRVFVMVADSADIGQFDTGEFVRQAHTQEDLAAVRIKASGA